LSIGLDLFCEVEHLRHIGLRLAGVGGQVEICFDFISLCDEVASRGEVLLFLSGLNDFIINAINCYSLGFRIERVGLG